MDPAHRQIHVGLIGAGNWANHGHLPVLALLKEYKVVAIQARRREAAETAARRFAIEHIVDTEDELLALPDLDLVLVLNITPQHADTVRKVIAAGKDVYCEWPLTAGTRVAEELLGLARAKGVRHAVGLQRKVAPHNRFVRDLLAEGYIGRVRSVRMHVSTNYFQAIRPQALAWTIPPANSSSVIAIFAGHFLDMLFQAVGRPTSLSALMINQFAQVTVAETGEVLQTTAPDQFVLAASLPGNAVLSAHVEGGKRNGSGVQIDITGGEGDIRITNTSAFGGAGDDYVIAGAKGNNLPLSVLEIPSSYDWLPPSDLPSAVLELTNLYRAFARDRAKGTRTAPDFEDALWLHRFLESCEASSTSGRRVDLG